MPYDMLVKWPKRNETIDAITEMEEQSLREALVTYNKNIVVFIIRDDAAQADISEYIKGVISEYYAILFSKELTREQVEHAIQFTRGGNGWNWIKTISPGRASFDYCMQIQFFWCCRKRD